MEIDLEQTLNTHYQLYSLPIDLYRSSREDNMQSYRISHNLPLVNLILHVKC